MIGPLQPQEERLGDDAPPSEIDEAVEVIVGTGDAGHGNLLQNFKFFGPDEDALGRRTVQVAHGGADHIHVGSLLSIRPCSDRARMEMRVMQRDHRSRSGIVGNEDRGEILVGGSSPMERSRKALLLH